MVSFPQAIANLLDSTQQNVTAHSGVLLSIFGVLCLSLFTNVVCKIFFHPLSNLPGPKLAAVTDLWTTYYELRGTLPWTVEKLRKQNHWNEVIRVGPNRVAIHDPAQYDVIYKIGSKFTKDPSLYENLPNGSGGSTTATAIDKSFHSTRRKATMGKLSKQKIGQLQPLVAENLEMLMSRFRTLVQSGKSVDVYSGWRSMTMDIIATFAFGTPLNSLDDPNFNHPMLHIMETAVSGFYLVVRIPFALAIIDNPWINWMLPGMKETKAFKKYTLDCVEGYKPDPKKHYLFDTLMSPDNVPQLSKAEVRHEAEDILVAGADTTAITLTYACVELARKPELWERLYQEVQPVYGDPNVIPGLQAVENLPFLNACLKESLRVASPVSSYLWRVNSAPEPITLNIKGKEVVIPQGTSVGLSSNLVHYDPEVFKEPQTFNPDRWLRPEDGTLRDDLDRFLVPFSKGTRQCGGINMAWMELLLSIATMVMRFGVKGNDGENVMQQKDCFVGILTEKKYNVILRLRERGAEYSELSFATNGGNKSCVEYHYVSGN